MKKVEISVGLLLFSMTGSFAGYYDAPTLKVTADIRQYAIGARIEVFGGATFAQNGDVNVSSPALPGFSTSVSAKNQFGGVAGIKGGYTWPGWNKDADASGNDIRYVNGDFAVLPSVDYECFWTGYKFKGQGSFDGLGTQLTADVNAYVFSVDPTVRFQIGMFRPYVGVGIGGAYITADNGVASASGIGSTNLVGSADDFCFAVQGLAGCEVFLAKNWALSLDYKYLDFVSPTFKAGSGPSELDYKSDSIGQHILTAGLNYYF